MTPDGTPILGKTRIDNLYLNTGHGTLGLDDGGRIGPGAGRSDLGPQAEIETGDLAYARYA